MTILCEQDSSEQKVLPGRRTSGMSAAVRSVVSSVNACLMESDTDIPGRVAC